MNKIKFGALLTGLVGLLIAGIGGLVYSEVYFTEKANKLTEEVEEDMFNEMSRRIDEEKDEES